MRVAYSVAFVANLPVALFTVMALYAGLFGLAAPEPNPARWVSIASPILLAAWLAIASRILARGHVAMATMIATVPPLSLSFLLFAAVR